MKKKGKKLKRGTETAEEGLVCCDCVVQRNAFAVGIGDGDSLGTRSERGNCDGKRVDILERDCCPFSADGDANSVDKTTTANRKGCPSGGRNRGGLNRANPEGYRSKLNNREPGVLCCAVRGSDGEKALAAFIGCEERTVEAVHIGHELLGEKNPQTKRAGMSVKNIHAAFHSGAPGCAG